MLAVLCLLMATSALAADFGSYMGQQPQRAPHYGPGNPSTYPIDYEDDLFQGIKPGSNFIYNFEMTRRDQPPQIEMRNEDIGRYMYRKHSTTTTPVPSMNSFNDFPVQVPEDHRQSQDRLPQMYTSENQHQTWNQKTNDYPVHAPEVKRERSQAQVPMNTPMENKPQSWDQSPTPVEVRPPPPPPPALKWNKQDYSQNIYNTPPNWNSYQREVSTPAPAQWSSPSRTHAMLSRSSEEIAPRTTTVKPEIVASASLVQLPAAVQHRQHGQHGQHGQGEQHGSHNRGTHKFSATMPDQEPTVTPATQPRGPPPPIPTLSPWYGDNFGK